MRLALESEDRLAYRQCVFCVAKRRAPRIVTAKSGNTASSTCQGSEDTGPTSVSCASSSQNSAVEPCVVVFDVTLNLSGSAGHPCFRKLQSSSYLAEVGIASLLLWITITLKTANN